MAYQFIRGPCTSHPSVKACTHANTQVSTAWLQQWVLLFDQLDEVSYTEVVEREDLALQCKACFAMLGLEYTDLCWRCAQGRGVGLVPGDSAGPHAGLPTSLLPARPDSKACVPPQSHSPP